jgi:hypothetical protein
LEGNKRAEFFATYLDPAPQDVLTRCSRSLCLVRPSRVWARFSLDAYSGKYEARMGFELETDEQATDAQSPTWQTVPRGVTVTDLRWRALGRKWLTERGGTLELEPERLHEQLGVDGLYLTVGLSRAWKGKCWPLVVGVHAVPDYVVD